MDKQYESTVRMGPLIVLFVMGILRATSGNNCTTLEVLDGADKVTDVSCTEYHAHACSFRDTSDFPVNLASGLSVPKPREFKVSLFRQNFTKENTVFEASGITYTWKVPIDAAGRKLGTGYFINKQLVGSGANSACKILALPGKNLADSTEVHFKYTLFPLDDDVLSSLENWGFGKYVVDTYLVELLSLPPPSVQEYELGLFQRHVVGVPKARNLTAEPVVYPKFWKTWISLELFPKEGKIEVTFGLPKQGSLANFTKYKVQLVRANERNSFKQKNITTGVFNFTEVPAGSYRVQLFPLDTYFNDFSHCLCWHTSVELKRDCGSCRTTTTSTFNFTRSVFPPPPPVASPTSDNPFPETESGLIGGEIAVAVLVPVIVIGLALLAGGCFWNRWKSRNSSKRFERNSQSNNVQPDTQCMQLLLEQALPVAPALTRKSVVVLASEDHQHFNQAVLSFVRFLGLHCQCDVTFAPDRLPEIRKTPNSYCWLSGKIDKADYVVIVTSEAACRLYEAYRGGLVYKEADFGPEGNLFTPAMGHICGKITSSADVSNIMMVHFEHTTKMLPIALPQNYRLPDRLKSLLLHIHDLDDNKMNLSRVNLPLNGNVGGLEGGKEWLRAVHESMEFERNTPDWFERKFGVPTDSRCNGDNSLESQVSRTSVRSHESGFFDAPPSLGNCVRRLSSISSHEDDPASGFINRDLRVNDKELYRPSKAGKSGFYAPSEVLSAYTYQDSTCTAAKKDVELDRGCSISNRMRDFNRRNEQDWSHDHQQQHQQQQGPDCIPHDGIASISDQTNSSHAVQFQYPDQDGQAPQFKYPDQDSHHLDNIKFYAPSEALSANTCQDSTYTAAETSEELDRGCSISNRMRDFNQRNELDWSQDHQQQKQQGRDCIPHDGRSAISDQTNSPHALQFEYTTQDSHAPQFDYPDQNSHALQLECPDQYSHHLDPIDIVEHDLECHSLSSVQSV